MELIDHKIMNMTDGEIVEQGLGLAMRDEIGGSMQSRNHSLK
jgi:hypothetical protein